jgi:hypothetical protein
MDNNIFTISGVLAVYVLLPIFSVSFVVGYMFRIRTKQTFLEILKRAILISAGLSLPIGIVLGKWMWWWLSGYSPN